MPENNETERLDSPLVVHKETDESYYGTGVVLTDATHDSQESAPTIERHRFQKDKKEKTNKFPIVLMIVILIAAAAAAVLIKFDVINIDLQSREKSTADASVSSEAENPFKNTITVQGMYIFYEGIQMQDIYALQKQIQYLPQSTELTVQDENANSDLLNYNVMPLLQSLGLNYTVTYVKSTGLVPQANTDPNFNLEEFNQSLASIEEASNASEQAQQSTQSAQ